MKEETEARQKAIAAGLVKVTGAGGEGGDVSTEEEEKKLKALMEGMSETDIQQVCKNFNRHKFQNF